MIRTRTSRFVATAGATAIAVTALAAPAQAQGSAPDVYTVQGTNVGCSVSVAGDQRYAYCTDLDAEMKPIPNSDGLSGVDTVVIERGASWNGWTSQGWGGNVTALPGGSIRFNQGLIFIADFKGGMHVFDGFRYSAYVGHGQAIANPGLGQLSSGI